MKKLPLEFIYRSSTSAPESFKTKHTVLNDSIYHHVIQAFSSFTRSIARNLLAGHLSVVRRFVYTRTFQLVLGLEVRKQRSQDASGSFFVALVGLVDGQQS